jgi:hypothetical protein
MFFSWLHGSYKEVEETYIFHKLEIIRTVNKTISESPPMAKPGIVEAINSLSMTEVRSCICFLHSDLKGLLLHYTYREAF